MWSKRWKGNMNDIRRTQGGWVKRKEKQRKWGQWERGCNQQVFDFFQNYVQSSKHQLSNQVKQTVSVSETIILINHMSRISHVHFNEHSHMHARMQTLTNRLPHKVLDSFIAQEQPTTQNHSCRPHTHLIPTHTGTTRLTRVTSRMGLS